MESMKKPKTNKQKLHCTLKHESCLQEEHLCNWLISWTSLSSFFPLQTPFLLEEWLTIKLWLFRFGHLAGIFFKMNKKNLSLQGKQLIIFVTKDKNLAFNWKLEIWKTYIRYCELDSFQILKGFLMRSVAILANVIFWYNKIYQHLEDLLNSVNLYLLNDEWYYKIMHG